MIKYNDLELSILSCLLQKPTLMNELILEDKHFIKYQRLWQFMKAFYKKFKTFDITLMFSVCKNRYQLMSFMMTLIEAEPLVSLFNTYQKQLIDLHEENKKEKAMINVIYKLANDLYVRNITLDEFKNEIDKIYIKKEL